MVKPLAVVAVGGNALIQDEQRNSIPDQYVAVRTITICWKRALVTLLTRW